MRKKIVAGNWKMNKTPKEAAEFCKLMKEKVVSDAIEVVFCVPFVDLYPVLEELKGTGIGVGAENMHFAESGAYTGEVSAQMLKEMGVGYVILGHSERRQYFGETDEMVNQKVKKALETGIVPILCCGETLELSGQSARAKPQPLYRHRRSAMQFVPFWQSCTARKRQRKSVSSTAAVSTAKMRQSCSQWRILTAVWSAAQA